MHGSRHLRIRPHRAIPAIIAVGALTLAGCSSSDSTDTEADEAPAPQVQESDTETSVEEEAPITSAEAVALLPFDAEAPSGYTMVTAECPDTDEAAQAEDATLAERYRTPITFAVPETWSPMGQGSGGSGSITGTDVELDFDTDSGVRVTVDQEWDSFTMDGEIADDSGEPWESFDYEWSSGDETTMITYDEVATVTIEDQEIALFSRDPAQAPEDLTQAQYKARIDVFEAPRSQFEADATRVSSFVVTIEFAADDATITQDVVETIVGSYTIPSCTWDELIDEQELLLQLDLDGDGKVKTTAELQQELQEELEALQEDLEE